jgi:tight adherence protein C
VIPLPAAWGALVLAGAWFARPGPRARQLRPSRRSTTGPRAAALLVPSLAIAVVLLPPPVAVALVAAAFAAPRVLVTRARRRREATVQRSLPEVVDLVHLAVGAGLNVHLAVEAVTRRIDGPLADDLRLALDEVALGRRLGDALGDVPLRAGESVRPLLNALVTSDRYGAPLGDALALLAAEVRADRRRRAEEAARRVPVKLLFPLVLCVLPAFGLLTLVPLIAGAVSALRP